MHLFIASIFCVILSAGCSKIKTTSTTITQVNSSPTVLSSPTKETVKLLKPVVTEVKMNSQQKKYLNESLPPKVREVLEKSEMFEILAEVNNQPDGLNFEPKRIARVINDSDKKEILEAFYYDASGGDYPSACYIPHHKIRANYQGKTVEVEICFQCHLFFVESPFGKFDGGIVKENGRSEDIFNRIIQNQSVEIKQ